MYKAKMTTKGQLTLPKELRDKIGLHPGDYLEIRETAEGYYIEKQVDVNRFRKYIGILNRPGDSDRMVEELRD